MCLVQASDVPPHPIVGILADDHDAIVREAGMVAREVVGAGGPVDFIEMSATGEGLSAFFFEHMKPFYDRRIRES